MILRPDGSEFHEAEGTGPAEAGEMLGARTARALKDRAAADFFAVA